MNVRLGRLVGQTVQLDLEAKGIIRRRNSRPLRLHRT